MLNSFLCFLPINFVHYCSSSNDDSSNHFQMGSLYEEVSPSTACFQDVSLSSKPISLQRYFPILTTHSVLLICKSSTGFYLLCSVFILAFYDFEKILVNCCCDEHPKTGIMIATEEREIEIGFMNHFGTLFGLIDEFYR